VKHKVRQAAAHQGPQIDKKTPKLFSTVGWSFHDKDVDIFDDCYCRGKKSTLKNKDAPHKPSEVAKRKVERAKRCHCNVHRLYKNIVNNQVKTN
jgi:hypothetical protein